MAVNVRVRDKDQLAVFLGWFSIGLGVAQLAVPRLMCKLVGANTDGSAPKVMRSSWDSSRVTCLRASSSTASIGPQTAQVWTSTRPS